MNEPKWIRLEGALIAHVRQLARHGGMAGVRDSQMLDFALARPRDLLAYGSPDMADLAACHASGVVRNHPFLDGNKRTALATRRQ